MAEHNTMNSHKIPFASIGSMVGLRGRGRRVNTVAVQPVRAVAL